MAFKFTGVRGEEYRRTYSSFFFSFFIVTKHTDNSAFTVIVKPTGGTKKKNGQKDIILRVSMIIILIVSTYLVNMHLKLHFAHYDRFYFSALFGIKSGTLLYILIIHCA